MTQTEEQPFLFVGLGNPGPLYEMTRHNMGYLVVQALARRLAYFFKEDKRFNARVAKGVSEGKAVHLLLPLTYMNLSGTAVRRYMDYFKIPLSGLIVITDDIALSFGQLRLRAMGSAGGHNGLKSIETHVGTNQYMRLRMGIGHPGQQVLTDYVLGPFSLLEQQELPSFIDGGVEILQRLLKEQILQVMNTVNSVSGRIQEPTDLTKPPLQG